MENIKVINKHFVVISDTEVAKNVYPQDEWKWEYRVYALNGVQVKFQDGDFYKSVTRPTEEQCLRDFFQRRKLVLTDSLAKASSEKLSIDKVLEQLDLFEKVIEINTVLKTLGKPKLEDYDLVKLTVSNVVQGARVYSLGSGFGTITDINRLHIVTIDITFDNNSTIKNANLFF